MMICLPLPLVFAVLSWAVCEKRDPLFNLLFNFQLALDFRSKWHTTDTHTTHTQLRNKIKTSWKQKGKAASLQLPLLLLLLPLPTCPAVYRRRRSFRTTFKWLRRLLGSRFEYRVFDYSSIWVVLLRPARTVLSFGIIIVAVVVIVGNCCRERRSHKVVRPETLI